MHIQTFSPIYYINLGRSEKRLNDFTTIIKKLRKELE